MEFLDYFSNVFTVYHLALLIGGTFAGIILGALPGLSPTMSVGLLIPFTFHMKPESGLISIPFVALGIAWTLKPELTT